MTQKHLFLKNTLIIGEMDKRYNEFMHILWKNLPYTLNILVDLGDFSFAPTSVKTKQCVKEGDCMAFWAFSCSFLNLVVIVSVTNHDSWQSPKAKFFVNSFFIYYKKNNPSCRLAAFLSLRVRGFDYSEFYWGM